MNYQLSFKKFITSQHLSTGINVTIAVLVPGIILYRYDMLSIAIGIPLGAMFVSLSDSAGPPQHRTNGMIAAILLNSLMILVAGFSYAYPVLATIEIAIFGIILSMGGVFGNRTNNIGIMALIAFILGGAHITQNPWQQSFYYLIGGAWYALFSLTSYQLRPYKLVEQLVGESLIEINNYLQTKGELYSKNVNYATVYEKLLPQQIAIHKLQEDIRELMFKTRTFVKESTDKSRRLMMIFLDSIDLFEQIMTTQQDYAKLHKDFDDTTILDQYHFNIKTIAHTLELVGISIQSANYRAGSYHYQQELAKSKQLFSAIRKEHLNAATVEAFITLRHILYNLEKLTERLDRIVVYLNKKEKIKQPVNITTQPFITHQQFNFRMFFSNLTISSVHFRHALRVTIALLCGYIISLYFPLGHGYWILLSIASIMKPSFGTSKKRNFERVLGTVTGALAGFSFLYITQNHAAIFIAMLIAMATAYSFLRLQYFVSSAFITLYVLLSFYFLQGTLAGVFNDRVIDTLIGSAISFVCSYFILPSWEYSSIKDVVLTAIKANKEYFIKATGYFTGNAPTELDYKIARKGAFVTLANLSEALQRMLTDPKSRQHALQDYHQFTVTHHILTSYIASISYYAGQFTNTIETKDFISMVNTLNKQFDQLILLAEGNTEATIEMANFPFNKRVEKLLMQRKQQLTEGTESVDIRKTLSELKSITDQFLLVHAVLNDEIKILKRIYDV
jgi:uncharacterized membrane protein (TIGR01666 family)